MATVKGVLGQAAPAATTLEVLYTCPTSKNATVKVIVANRSTQTSFRISVAIDAAADSDEQYIAYDEVINANASASSVSFMVGGDDVVRVYGGSADLSFTCTGIEQDD